MVKAWLRFAYLSAILFAANGADLGSSIKRTYQVFHDLPLTIKNATSSGWERAWRTCDPNLGFAYIPKGGFSVANPIVMYYTAAGQVAGVGTIHFGAPLAGQLKFWQPLHHPYEPLWTPLAPQTSQPLNESVKETYIMNVHFRTPSVICSKQAQSEVVGSQVVINQGAINFNVPITEYDAAQANWTAGNCIPMMGTHWAYDLISAPLLSYKADRTVPLLPMYFKGAISAIFIDTATLQEVTPKGIWEGPFTPATQCYNFCKGACTWDSPTTVTLHFIFQSPPDLMCTSQCYPFKNLNLSAMHM